MKKLTIFINGETFVLNKGISIKELLDFLSLKEKEIVIEFEKVILDQKTYKKVYVTSNTRLEILNIVGGG